MGEKAMKDAPGPGQAWSGSMGLNSLRTPRAMGREVLGRARATRKVGATRKHEERRLAFHAGILRGGRWKLPPTEIQEWREGLPIWKLQEYKRLDEGMVAERATLANVRKARRRSRRWSRGGLPATPPWQDDDEEEDAISPKGDRGSRTLVVLKDWVEEQGKG